MSSFDISTATHRDLPAIMTLEADGFCSGWSGDAWAAEIEGHDRHVVVARLDEEIVGVATFQVVEETADLHRIVVRASIRGRGLGTHLVRNGLAWAQRTGAERMLLEVEHDNEPALALYRSLEFDEIARRRDYYGVGRDALVMERSLA